MLVYDWLWWGQLTNQNRAWRCAEVHGGVWRGVPRCAEVRGGVHVGARRCAEVCRGVHRGARRCMEG